MKKIAIGCGILLVLLVIGGAIGTYFVVNKVKSTVEEFASLASVPDIEREITNRAGFAAPPSGELSDEQVSRYIRVQEHMRTHLGVRFDELNSKYQDLSRRMNAQQGSVLDAPEIIGAYRDLAKTYVDAKRAQVQALNQHGFSLNEYRWVRQQAYAALGVPIMNMDVSAFIEDVKEGNTPDQAKLEGAIEPTGPERNRQLVAPHKKVLEDNVALSFFGL